jgi:hypothetical protein
MEQRDALIVELTKHMKEILDDEHKRLKAAIKLRQEQYRLSRLRDQEAYRAQFALSQLEI